MIELVRNARWDQLYALLADGEPPMIARILALNTVFFILFAIRRTRGVPAMRRQTAIQVQSLLVLANWLVLFQNEIQDFMRKFI